MAYADIPLTSDVIDAVRRSWGITIASTAYRLQGGEESAAYGDGAHVVRIGPRWRPDASVEWCHAVALGAARSVPEVVAPLPVTSDPMTDPGGAGPSNPTLATPPTTVRVDGRPISVWHQLAGQHADERDPGQRAQAADLLARLHRALRDVDPGPRPESASPTTEVPDLADPELDAWLGKFERTYAKPGHVQPLHGDYYAGNMLAAEGRIIALLDWDEAFIGPPEWELAGAAWEWGDVLWTLDLTAALDFIAAYVDAGGPAEPVDEVTLRQLIRQRIRMEIAYSRAVAKPGEAPDPDDAAYDAQQLKAFAALRP